MQDTNLATPLLDASTKTWREYETYIKAVGCFLTLPTAAALATVILQSIAPVFVGSLPFLATFATTCTALFPVICLVLLIGLLCLAIGLKGSELSRQINQRNPEVLQALLETEQRNLADRQNEVRCLQQRQVDPSSLEGARRRVQESQQLIQEIERVLQTLNQPDDQEIENPGESLGRESAGTLHSTDHQSEIPPVQRERPGDNSPPVEEPLSREIEDTCQMADGNNQDTRSENETEPFLDATLTTETAKQAHSM